MALGAHFAVPKNASRVFLFKSAARIQLQCSSSSPLQWPIYVGSVFKEENAVDVISLLCYLPWGSCATPLLQFQLGYYFGTALVNQCIWLRSTRTKSLQSLKFLWRELATGYFLLPSYITLFRDLSVIHLDSLLNQPIPFSVVCERPLSLLTYGCFAKVAAPTTSYSTYVDPWNSASWFWATKFYLELTASF